MDRPITRKWYERKRLWWTVGGGVAALLLLYVVLTTDTRSRQVIDYDHLTVATIERGPFQVYIPLTGSVRPLRTVYLDAMEGGRVESVMREVGSLLEAGDTILHLSNTALLLDIMNREAQLFEQRNNLRNTRLAFQQNALRLETELLDLKRQLDLAERSYEQYAALYERDLISQNEYETARDEHNYLKRRLELTTEAQRQDSVFRNLQVEMLEGSVERIQQNLEFVHRSMDNLYVCAPVGGQLTSLSAEVGESKNRGERLGQIDILDGFKIRAAVDELYLARVSSGLHGTFALQDKTYELLVTKVYPSVRDGRFEVDMEFVDEPPASITRGQSVHLRLELGNVEESILVRRGPFYHKTGGRWIYVLDPSGEFATKREIRIGQQNPDHFEVLGGLEKGEQVIISSYENFGDVDKLIFDR